jgi:tetratricopeptide (TPR) repeat protein
MKYLVPLNSYFYIKRYIIALCFFLFPYILISGEVKTKIDSLKIKLELESKNEGKSLIKLKLLNELAKEYVKISTVQALDYAFQAVNIGRDLTDTTDVYDVYHTIGLIYQEQGMYDKSFSYYRKVLLFFEQVSDKEASAWSYVNVGNVLFAKQDYQRAKEYYNKALQFFIKDQDKYGQATVLCNLGLIFNEQNQTDSALFMFSQALDYGKEISNNTHIGLSNKYLGHTYLQAKQIDEARIYFNKALEIFKLSHDYKRTAELYLLLGDLALKINDYKGVLQNYQFATNLFIQEKGNSGLAMSLNKTAEVYKLKNNKQKAIETAKKALQIGESNNLLIEQQNSLYLLYNLYTEIENYKNAFYFYEKYFSIRDSVFNENLANQISRLEIQIIENNYEKEISLLSKNKEIQELKLKKKTNLIYYFIITTLILLMLVLSNLRKFNYKAKLAKQFSFETSLFSKAGVVLLSGLYFVIILVIFQPFGFSKLNIIEKLYLYGGFGIISMLVLFINFLLFYFLERIIDNEKWELTSYFFFIFSIVFEISLFNWLFTGYFTSENVIASFFEILTLVFSLTIFPIFIILLFIEKIYLKKHTRIAEVLSHHLKNIEQPAEDNLITIKSDKTKEEVKFLESELQYIKAKGNYSEIHFIKNSVAEKKMMLVSLKIVEEKLKSVKNLVRCHKSYIINIRRIVRISGNSQGYKLHFEKINDKIPVSRSFPKSVLTDLINMKN